MYIMVLVEMLDFNISLNFIMYFEDCTHGLTILFSFYVVLFLEYHEEINNNHICKYMQYLFQELIIEQPILKGAYIPS